MAKKKHELGQRNGGGLAFEDSIPCGVAKDADGGNEVVLIDDLEEHVAVAEELARLAKQRLGGVCRWPGQQNRELRPARVGPRHDRVARPLDDRHVAIGRRQQLHDAEQIADPGRLLSRRSSTPKQRAKSLKAYGRGELDDPWVSGAGGEQLEGKLGLAIPHERVGPGVVCVQDKLVGGV